MSSFVSEGYSQVEESKVVRGDQIKAAFLYYVMKFTDWSSKRTGEDSEQFTLCLVGDEGVADQSTQVLAGKYIHNKPILLKPFKKVEDDSAEHLLQCHGVFFGIETQPSQALLQTLAEGNVLTIGENSGFLKQGGMVHIFEDDNRIKFDANLFTIQSSGLRISSDMLQLARHIRGNGVVP
jgi:hypothetical protein